MATPKELSVTAIKNLESRLGDNHDLQWLISYIAFQEKRVDVLEEYGFDKVKEIHKQLRLMSNLVAAFENSDNLTESQASAINKIKEFVNDY